MTAARQQFIVRHLEPVRRVLDLTGVDIARAGNVRMLEGLAFVVAGFQQQGWRASSAASSVADNSCRARGSMTFTSRPSCG
jgi:hypothetical protein